RAKAQGSYLAIAHLHVRGEGAAGTLDQAVAIMLDAVPVGSGAVRTDHARSGPDDTRVLVVDQLTDQFLCLLQFAGEAGDLPDDLLQRLSGQAVGAEAKGDRPALDALHAVQRLTLHTTPPALRAPRPLHAVRPPNPHAGSPAAGHRSPRSEERRG